MVKSKKIPYTQIMIFTGGITMESFVLRGDICYSGVKDKIYFGKFISCL